MSQASKKKIRRFKIECAVYPYALFVMTGGTKQQAIDWFNLKFKGRKEPPESKDTLYGSVIYLDGEMSHLIWFHNAKPGGGIVAHEALHSVLHVLRLAGVGKLCPKNEEAYAYLLMWTVVQIGKRLW